MIHNFHRRRILFSFLLVCGGFTVVIARLVQLQISQGPIWENIKDHKAERRIMIPGVRGKILSATGTVLAQSVPVQSLYADPLQIADPTALAKDLAPLVEMDVSAILRKVMRATDLPGASPSPSPSPAAGPEAGPEGSELQTVSVPTTTTTTAGTFMAMLPKVFNEPPPMMRKRVASKFVWVKRKLDDSQYLAVKQLIENKKIKGLGFRKESKRIYPNNMEASQVLGFCGTDEEGLAGLEQKFNGVLGGKPGERRVIMAPNGMILHELAKMKPEGFNNIHLTIDPVIQHYVERELDKAVVQYSPKTCFAAAMDPNTGELLAMASRPNFDPNNFREYDRETWKNRVVTDGYEPGSPFKLITISAALEDNRVEPTSTFFCPGKVILWDMPLHCLGVHETVTVEQIIEKSCNAGAVKVGEVLGPKNLYYYIRKFGFADRTGVDLPSEFEGLVRPPEKWSGISIGAVSIGQEILVSGIQMMQAVAAIANGGRLVRPHVIQKITDADDNVVVQEQSLDVRHRVITPKVAEEVTKMMCMVTKSGSGTNGALDDYVVAGKTGTSEKLGRAKEEGHQGYVVSFIGFLPAKEPKALIYVVLNEPKGEHIRGGTMAAPVFREIARQVMLLKKVPPEVGAGTPITQPAAPAPEPREEDDAEPASPAAPASVAPAPKVAEGMKDEEGEGPDDAEGDARTPAGADEQ